MIIVVENERGAMFEIRCNREDTEARKNELKGWGLRIVEVRPR